jgi:hypothetical protein
LVSVLKGLPPLSYDLGFAQGDERARDMAIQLRGALTAAGWTCESMIEMAKPPVPLGIFVPQPSQSSAALVNWARRNGYDPEVRPVPKAPRLRIVIGSPKS